MRENIPLLRPLAALSLMFALVACGGSDEADTSVPETTGEEPVTTTSPPTGVDRQLAGALADLCDRLGVDEDEIYVRSHDAVTWPDGSIGCPEPGMAYTEALVDGVQILLEVDGEVYAYHAAGDDDPAHCE